jgi:hypothetical protein
MKKFHFGILKIRPLNIADLLCYEKMCSPPLFFAWVPPRLCLGGGLCPFFCFAKKSEAAHHNAEAKKWALPRLRLSGAKQRLYTSFAAASQRCSLLCRGHGFGVWGLGGKAPQTPNPKPMTPTLRLWRCRSTAPADISKNSQIFFFLLT